jgi:hypothetical protein
MAFQEGTDSASSAEEQSTLRWRCALGKLLSLSVPPFLICERTRTVFALTSFAYGPAGSGAQSSA